MKDLVPTIGIEVHAELKTKSKVFSTSPNSYGQVANSKINVIDLGYPGTLPVLNKEVINLAIKAAIALNCKIQPKMYFDRKNYFYPDLPKGYQITQATTPIGHDGYVEIEYDGKKKKIGIERIHIEEDTCKSIHERSLTLLDFNRAGIPLIEIVSQPVIENEREAVLYIEKLRELLLYTEVSDVKIEEGSMRCDANVSLKEKDSPILGTRTEIKNIGSISNVKEAILYEIDRQKEAINKGDVLREETRKYDESTSTTVLMRSKETTNDYRYFPEPDIPYIYIGEDWINTIKEQMPMLPDKLREVYREIGINDNSIKTLIQNKDITKFLNEVIKQEINPVMSANLLAGDVLAYLNKHNIILEKTKLTSNNFIELVTMLNRGDISSKIGKDLLIELLENGGKVEDILVNKGIKQINNTEELDSIVKKVIDDNPNAINDYRNGYDRAVKYLMGQIMKETKGQANPTVVSDILNKYLSNI